MVFPSFKFLEDFEKNSFFIFLLFCVHVWNLSVKLFDHGIFFVEMFWLWVHSLAVIVRFAISSDLPFLPGSVLEVYAFLEICAFHPVHSMLL